MVDLSVAAARMRCLLLVVKYPSETALSLELRDAGPRRVCQGLSRMTVSVAGADAGGEESGSDVERFPRLERSTVVVVAGESE